MREHTAVAMCVAVALFGAGTGAARAQPAPPLPPVPSPPPPPPRPSIPLPPPPPYYYPPPAQGPTYYPPPAVAPAATYTPPAVVPRWEPDEPVPEGYRVVTRPSVGYLGIGIGMLSAGYTTAIVSGAVASADAKRDTRPDAVGSDAWIPMYIPVVGPFITIVTTNQGPAGMGLLMCDGIFQTAGLLGILLGSLRTTHKLVPTGLLETVEVAPAVGTGVVGFQATGQF